MKHMIRTALLALLLTLTGFNPVNAQFGASASHTVTITILPAADMDADPFIAFGLSRDSDINAPLVAETRTSLAVHSSTEDVRVAIGLSEDLPSNIRLRLADDSGNRVPLSTSSMQVLAASHGSGAVDLTFEAEVDGDWLYEC